MGRKTPVGHLQAPAGTAGRNPEPSGGTTLLGISTVIDRLIQQALLQVLTPIFDPEFFPHSYGFRPDRVNHDLSMPELLAR
jgi:retron-type reverse transcriptase